MDFARRQLEKYGWKDGKGLDGWKDGKGLGKHENGIAVALKPKLKRSVTGIGHDAASDFNEHWWEELFDKAANNIQVQQKNGKTKKIQALDEKFEITNSAWRLKKKKRSHFQEEEYGDYFVKTAVLNNDGVKEETIRDTDSDRDEDKGDALKMTDEELFAACAGRTAHKGARHGLLALGKLARIEQQERMMLSLPQYEGYTHAKSIKKYTIGSNSGIVENTNVINEELKIKIKKKNQCKGKMAIDEDISEAKINKDKIKVKEKDYVDFIDIEELKLRKKKRKQNEIVVVDNSNLVNEENKQSMGDDIKKTKKKKIRNNTDIINKIDNVNDGKSKKASKDSGKDAEKTMYNKKKRKLIIL